MYFRQKSYKELTQHAPNTFKRMLITLLLQNHKYQAKHYTNLFDFLVPKPSTQQAWIITPICCLWRLHTDAMHGFTFLPSLLVFIFSVWQVKASPFLARRQPEENSAVFLIYFWSLGCTAGKGVVGGGGSGRSRRWGGGALLSNSLIRRHVAPSVIVIPMIDLLSLLPLPPHTQTEYFPWRESV